MTLPSQSWLAVCGVLGLLVGGCGGANPGTTGNTGGGSETGDETGDETGGTGETGEELEEIPLGDCPAGPGSPQGGNNPLTCTVEASTWCDGCPITDQALVSCELPIYPRLATAPDGHPWMVADPASSGIAPTLIEFGDMPTFTSLPGIPVDHAVTVDGENTPHLLHGGDWSNPWLWHRVIPGADDEVIGCLTGQSLWTISDLEAGASGLVALVGWLQETSSGLALARRDLGGSWTIEDLGLAGSRGALALADDGTPVIAANGLIRVGMSTQADGFTSLPAVGVPSLVPGPTGLLAAAQLGETGIEISTLTQVGSIAETSPLVITGCDPSSLTSCEGSCQQTGQGPTWAPFAARDGDGILVAYVDVTIDVDAHFEGDICGGEGPGCSCDAIVDEDRSASELVLARVALPSLAVTEVARVALPFLATSPRIHGRQATNGIVTVALQGPEGPVRVGSFDPATLP